MSVKQNNDSQNNDMINNKDNTQFSFIQEQIVPKKKRRRKKICCAVMFSIVIAIIFGLVSSCIFCISRPFFEQKFNGNDQKAVLVNSTTPSPEPTQMPSPTSTPQEGSEEDPATVPTPTQEPKEVALNAYMSEAAFMTEISNDVHASIVTVEGVKSEVDLFNNSYEDKNISAGLVVAKYTDFLLVLASKSRVSEVDQVRVTFEGNFTIAAENFGQDSDIGIVILSVPINNLPKSVLDRVEVATFGESFSLVNGTPILALGSPNGYMYSMEPGIITNYEQSVYITDYEINLFNTDIKDNENGEGFITNLKGEIIGMISHNFKKGLNKDINTVIGVDKLYPVVEDLVSQKDRQYFGIVGKDIDKAIADKLGIGTGIYVTKVESESPAFKADIKTGDVIQFLDKTSVYTMSGFHAVLSKHEIKDEIKVTVIRTNGEERKLLELVVTVGKKTN